MTEPKFFDPSSPAEFDYVIVGAGSAGCVLANRLTENPANRVLLLEYGGTDNSLVVAMPSGLSMPMNSRRFNWGLKSEPEPHLHNRLVNLPRGKGLGGSSSINGMCYVRGNPMDYELWNGLGATGWNWRNVLPYFQRAENVTEFGPLRGRSGLLRVSRGRRRNPLYDAFIAAGVEAGYPSSSCMNELQHEGFGPMEMTVADGVRCSTAKAYLRPALNRKNLTVLTHAEVCRILFEQRAASGVEFRWKGRLCNARARREVVLCAGSVMSPLILKRSGLGPESELRENGIELLLDHPEVGENLMDHMEIHVQYRCIQPVSLSRNVSLVGKAKVGASWLLTRRGLGATNHFESGGHIRSRPGVPYPDIQYHFLPLAISYDGKRPVRGEGFQVHVGTKRSKSRGSVLLPQGCSDGPPKVQFNYMSSPDDWRDMRSCIRLTREIFSQPSMAGFCGNEIAPGEDAQDDMALDAFITEHATTAHHPCGTCRMGDDQRAVVDADCRVRGTENLRVVDSSIFPQATAGDLNAPTIMCAERAADIILGKKLMTADFAPILIDPAWKSKQRSNRTFCDVSCHEDLLDEAVTTVIRQTRPTEMVFK